MDNLIQICNNFLQMKGDLLLREFLCMDIEVSLKERDTSVKHPYIQ